MKSLQWKSNWRDITCVGGERAKTTTTGPHPKAAAEGGDVEGGTGLVLWLPGLWIIPGSREAQPYRRTLLLPKPLLCVLGWCETRGHHKAFCLNRDQSQLRSLALPIDSVSGEELKLKLKLHGKFRPLRFGSVWVEGFGWGCHRIKRFHEQCSAAPKTPPGPCNVWLDFFFPHGFGFLPASGCPVYHYW